MLAKIYSHLSRYIKTCIQAAFQGRRVLSFVKDHRGYSGINIPSTSLGARQKLVANAIDVVLGNGQE